MSPTYIFLLNTTAYSTFPSPISSISSHFSSVLIQLYFPKHTQKHTHPSYYVFFFFLLSSQPKLLDKYESHLSRAHSPSWINNKKQSQTDHTVSYRVWDHSDWPVSKVSMHQSIICQSSNHLFIYVFYIIYHLSFYHSFLSCHRSISFII